MKTMTCIAIVALSFLASCQSTPDTIRARKIELVDEDGCGRIILDAGKYGPSITVTAENGEPVWSATYCGKARDENGHDYSMEGFAIVGCSGKEYQYQLLTTERGVGMHLQSNDDDGFSIWYADGAVKLGLDAPDADKVNPGEPRSVSVKLTIEKGRLVVEDEDGHELTSFALPPPKTQDAPVRGAHLRVEPTPVIH